MTGPDLTGRVALVTGAAGGLGAAVAAGLAEAGAHVVLGDTDLAGATRTAAGIGGSASAVELDVRDAGHWDRTTSEITQRHGRWDVLVNNAGVYRKAPLAEMTDDDLCLVLDVNLRGTVLGTRAAARSMADGGAIVNVSSTAGLSGHRHALVYSATKFGVRGVTRSAALELGERGIRVNTVCPGPIETPMMRADQVDWSAVPLSRAADPREVAALITFLASDAAAYCTGGEHAVDGGLSA
ncbi:SDR family NAD(P)-dependent oxidoreductase [Pimelobacter simplex]|uniref:SDR family NAD(P)-dependent oxidoreductase n=1 Tax=Nocardioides simplex TaxID=2045 RepID=UPI00193445D4|nr:SDR family oxidoreductase [Pimelobacter simplex]